MLGDNPEKSKNPLKKAMRRRNAKTVQFAPPTYYEPSENEYSSDEEGEGEELPELADTGGLALQNSDSQSAQEEVATVEPLKIRSQQNEAAAKDEIQADMQAASEEPQVSKLRSSEDSTLRPGTPLFRPFSKRFLLTSHRRGCSRQVKEWYSP